MPARPKNVREAERLLRDADIDYRVERGVRHYHIWVGKDLLATLSTQPRKDTAKVRSAIRRWLETNR